MGYYCDTASVSRVQTIQGYLSKLACPGFGHHMCTEQHMRMPHCNEKFLITLMPNAAVFSFHFLQWETCCTKMVATMCVKLRHTFTWAELLDFACSSLPLSLKVSCASCCFLLTVRTPSTTTRAWCRDRQLPGSSVRGTDASQWLRQTTVSEQHREVLKFVFCDGRRCARVVGGVNRIGSGLAYR